MTEHKKIALVTGASRGIGKAIAAKLARQDIDVVVGTATNEQGASAISQSFQDQGLNVVGKVLNIGDPASVTALLSAIKTEYGMSPAILVNNAGVTRDNIMLRMKDDEWHDVINVNLNGTFYVTRACLKDMVKARWGRIISISSVVSRAGNPGQANYAASKGAIEAFTTTLAKEVASRGITVNAIAPGYIKTDMTEAMNDKQREMMLAAIPMKRRGEPEEIAEVAAFIASDAASYLTGQLLHVNGGMY
ncbi:MAG: 3-oxoacyl-ACP reductase FabG [Pseudomonadota bacterium]